MVHDRSPGKVLGQRRRLHLPLEARRLPGIVPRDGAVLQRPRQVENRQQVAHAQNRRARGRKHVQHLELRRVRRIPPRHPQRAQNELREECEIEPDERHHRRQLRDLLRIHPPRHLRPPEVDARKKRHKHPAHHHKVEMRHDEVRFRQVNVGS